MLVDSEIRRASLQIAHANQILLAQSLITDI